MSDNSDKALPKRWQKSDKAIRALQWAFDLNQTIQKVVRIKAAEQAISPSDCLRKILQLEVRSKQVRPRLTLSLNEDDIKLLAERYAICPDDITQIKAKAAAEIIHHVEENNDLT